MQHLRSLFSIMWQSKWPNGPHEEPLTKSKQLVLPATPQNKSWLQDDETDVAATSRQNMCQACDIKSGERSQGFTKVGHLTNEDREAEVGGR